MPSSTTARNPHGIDIEFNEENHLYKSVLPSGRTLIYDSVTTIVSKFFPKFDAERIAPFSAKKEGVTVKEILEKWKKAGDDACRLGTRVHECCEDTLLNRELRNTPENDREKTVFDYAVAMANKVKERIDILGIEKIVFNEKLQIAGSIDLFARSKKDGSYLILDWKTNKEITTSNKYGEVGLDPISHLEDTAYNHYALQLSLYHFLLEHTGYVDPGVEFKHAIIHLTWEKPKIIMLPYMKDEINNIIIDHLASKVLSLQTIVERTKDVDTESI